MERENRQIRRADYRAGYSDTRGGAADAGGAEKPDIRRQEKNTDITGDLPELLRQLRCW